MPIRMRHGAMKRARVAGMSNAGSSDVVERTQPAPAPASRALHDQDEFGWLLQQAELLRAGRLDEIDRHPLAEYLTHMAKSDARALKGALRVLLIHLLKILMEAERLTGSWVSTIIEQQDQASGMMADHPGMKPMLPKLFEDAYQVARRQAAAETGRPLAQLPQDNPWTLDQALAYVPPEPRPRGRQAARRG